MDLAEKCGKGHRSGPISIRVTFLARDVTQKRRRFRSIGPWGRRRVYLSSVVLPGANWRAGRRTPNETRRPPPGRLPKGASGPWPLVGTCAICASLFWGATIYHRCRYIPNFKSLWYKGESER